MKFVLPITCQCEGCTNNHNGTGLCTAHFNEMINARNMQRFREWRESRAVYQVRLNSKRSGFYRSCGEWVDDICPRCNKPYKRRRAGVRRKCPACLRIWVAKKCKKINDKIGRLRKVQRELQNIAPDQNPNLRPYRHKGAPQKVRVQCAEPGCRTQFDVLYMEHKTWYPRFCLEHHRKMYDKKRVGRPRSK